MTHARMLLLLGAAVMTGCASVGTESLAVSNQAKQFAPPSPGNSGVYVYREDTIVGAALKKDVYIDGECVGESAKGVFFYQEVEGNKDHVVSTESEFSPNDIAVYMKEGMNYFFEQYIKLGVFVGGAGIREVKPNEGEVAVSKLDMATAGTCGTQSVAVSVK